MPINSFVVSTGSMQSISPTRPDLSINPLKKNSGIDERRTNEMRSSGRRISKCRFRQYTARSAGKQAGIIDEEFTKKSNKIKEYYERMLRSHPTDPLLLRNFGKFLHEVENDTKRAEESYEKAIVANPSDGELLALYGKLIWEKDRDVERASFYFDQAVSASPNDCMVLGSYAHFMWEAESGMDSTHMMLT